VFNASVSGRGKRTPENRSKSVLWTFSTASLEPGRNAVSLNQRFVRWQTQTIAQLSFAINLFAGLSVAALGFGVSFLREMSFSPSRCYAVLYLASLAFLGVSVLCGIGATVTRLLDFRATTRTVRLRQTDPKSEEIAVVGDEAKGLGKATWRLFWALLGAFLIGIAGLTISLISVYGSTFLQRSGF